MTHNRWYGAPFAFIAAFAGMAGLYLAGQHEVYRGILEAWILFYNDPPFVDSMGIVSALECERLGFETYLWNPCHPQKGTLVYPPFWKLGAILPVTTAWNVPLALTFIAIFATALFWLPSMPDFRGRLLMIAGVVSPPTVMAVNYGNNELLIFALAVAGVWLWVGRRRRRWGAYAVFIVAALLKYFPVALLGLALREKPKRAIIPILAAGLTATVFILAAADQIRLSFLNIYTLSPFSYVFGVKNIGELAIRMNLASPPLALVIRLCLTLAIAGTAWCLSERLRARGVLDRLDPTRRAFLLAGSLLVVSAYFFTQNVAYRQVHLLLALPGLYALGRTECGRWASLAPIAVLLMYLFPLRIHLAGLFAEGSFAWGAISLFGILVRETAWVMLATCLLALALAGLRALPASVRIELRARRLIAGSG